MLLAVGALCGVPAARTALGRAVPSVLVAACRVLDALAALVSLVQTRGISAEVDRVIAEGAARSSGADAGGGADGARTNRTTGTRMNGGCRSPRCCASPCTG